MTLPQNAPEPQGQLRDFQSVVENYADFVYNVAYRMMGNAEDAEDVAQEAFLSAYRAFDRFRREAQVSTWLYRITVNASLMKLRKDQKARSLTDTSLDKIEVADWDLTPERSALMSELGEKLQQGLDQLDPDLRAAVVLRDVEGLSNSEAADILGITVAALKSRLHRGRLLLRKHLEGYLKGHGRD